MSQKIPEKWRRQVAACALFCCEYCHVPDLGDQPPFHIDHIFPTKHGGKTELENLAFACPLCNAHKGTDMGTFLKMEGPFVRFFNPRKDDWGNHFKIENGLILPKTDAGRATVLILKINDSDRVGYRNFLFKEGLFQS